MLADGGFYQVAKSAGVIILIEWLRRTISMSTYGLTATIGDAIATYLLFAAYDLKYISIPAGLKLSA